MDKSYKGNNSYSDLFEDFFRADAGAEADVSGATSAIPSSEIFEGFITNDNSSDNNTQAGLNDFFLDQQLQQFQSQQIAMLNPFYQSAGQMPMYAFAPTMPVSSGIHKPGFVRNRTRKNMRQKSVATAVKASHILGSVGQAGSGYPLIQNYQPQLADIPYYQMASQIPSFQPPQQIYMDGQKIQQQQQQQQHHHHQQQQNGHVQSQQPPLLLAKSPSVTAPPLLRPSNNSSSPNSASARSPNGTSSDYVKMRLQQKIRSRMVSKGQIPPNPTEEELRLCGVQIPGSAQMVQQQHHQQQQQQQQLPTPKSSPQQIPRAFNQFQQPHYQPQRQQQYQQPSNVINDRSSTQDDFMKYLDLTDYSEQKDPLAPSAAQMNPGKQQNFKQPQQQQQHQQQSHDLFFNQMQQQQYQQSQMEATNGAQTTTNYDQFFSDFILY